jgi:hypothetical protein
MWLILESTNCTCYESRHVDTGLRNYHHIKKCQFKKLCTKLTLNTPIFFYWEVLPLSRPTHFHLSCYYCNISISLLLHHQGYCYTNELCHDKTNIMGLWPAWIQTSAVWSGIMLFAISFSSCNRVCKRTAWILIRLSGWAGWSGSMLVSNPFCWFCHGTAQIMVTIQLRHNNKDPFHLIFNLH